jgi:hypothetical protein
MRSIEVAYRRMLAAHDRRNATLRTENGQASQRAETKLTETAASEMPKEPVSKGSGLEG